MEKQTTYIPTAADFMDMWRHLNYLAHMHGIVQSALSHHGNKGSDWMHYYLFRNNYETVGQSLLEYCLLQMLDVAATDQFSDFDLTGYALEPSTDEPEEDGTVVRQALMEEDIFHLQSFYSLQEVKTKLPRLIKAQGKLKVLVLPAYDLDKMSKCLRYIEETLFAQEELQGEYIVLLGRLTPHNEVSWGYRLYDKEGASDLLMMQELVEEND
ncbi:hypothetical protein K3G39_06865 [Pontibacter sp. HSC-14F20]|uniref:hypothetical protein n=1 Tax=Pontibacter sp. HSC-14F20 TaxID=2864136 RepID=UPI001C72B1A6|nr:hypothetical protein [Pontibacter sp. HSC-14F20]MBX0332954.1 hypothetical protein [Pontibacter sp. HSC-14F20]